jgi:hypothetical protein
MTTSIPDPSAVPATEPCKILGSPDRFRKTPEMKTRDSLLKAAEYLACAATLANLTLVEEVPVFRSVVAQLDEARALIEDTAKVM